MQAALALGEQKDARAIPSLLDSLNDKNANVVYHAIEALGKLRAQEAVGALAAIAESKDFFCRFQHWKH
jgi:HEAT repeat protein